MTVRQKDAKINDNVHGQHLVVRCIDNSISLIVLLSIERRLAPKA